LEDLYISTSGTRGIIGEGLRPDVALRFGIAFGRFCHAGRGALGRDTRPSGEMLKSAFCAGLLSVGADVVDLGVCPTPTLKIAVGEGEFAGGTIITASHNPPEWNGLKFITSDGMYADEESGGKLLELYDLGDASFATWDSVGEMSPGEGFIERHIEKVLQISIIDVDLIRSARFKVVLDPCNGAGALICPELLERFGCDVTVINGSPDGRFAHMPEPLPENLSELCRAVKEVGADIGLAVDPDADRLAMVSDEGEAIGEEYTLAFAAKLVLGKLGGTVVANVSTSSMIDDIAASCGAGVVRTPVGELNVVRGMVEVGASVGGEGNGGVILPEVHLGRDASTGIALILQMLAEEGRSVSEIVRSIPRYFMAKRKTAASDLDIKPAVERFARRHGGGDIDLTDGFKVYFGRSWVHVRRSKTEGVVRVIAEAPDPGEAEKLCGAMLAELKKELT